MKRQLLIINLRCYIVRQVRMSDADKAAAQGRAAARMVATAEAPVHVTAKSAELMAEARTLMPGGVSSPKL